METAYPHLTTVLATVTITSMLPSGAAFATRHDDRSDCYVPVNVARAVGGGVGDDFVAKLVPNRFARHPGRAPWLITHLSSTSAPKAMAVPVQYAIPFEDDCPDADADPEPMPTLPDRVRQTMQDGGVWTTRTMYEALFPGAAGRSGAADYAAVQAALQNMFAAGECAKFAMWRTCGQGHPTRVWYTCYPERADVDEWED